MNYDVVTLGESMLRLSPPGHQRFSQTSQFDVNIGGSESNTAVGLVRLGLKVAWLSRITDNPLGRMIVDEIRQHGVDVSHVRWTKEDRVGTYYWERGKSPRNSQVIYDRQGSAMSRIQPDDLPVAIFGDSSPRVFHTSGITCGISTSAAETALQAARLAKNSGWSVSFDLNYRAKLWTPEAARLGCHPIMSLADIIFIPARDVTTIYESTEDKPEKLLESLTRQFPQATIVLTLGVMGAAARTSCGAYSFQPAFEAEEIERLGGGDAFSAGFLYGWLMTKDTALALRWGAAVAAIKYSIPSDFPLVHFEEVESLVLGRSSVALIR